MNSLTANLFRLDSAQIRSGGQEQARDMAEHHTKEIEDTERETAMAEVFP